MLNSTKFAPKALFMVSVAASGLVLVSGCAATPKVLVDHSFRGKDKTSKVLLEQTAEKAEGKQLYNAYIRFCDLKSDKETDCKDTLVLPNVVSGSVY